jgi:uncharacterized BrkB/YihY/UPF0761 family membrane protein
MVKKLQIRITKLGWVAVPIGALVAAFAAVTLWFLFALKNFSSTVRDAYEAPPGVMQYIIFGIACLGLLLLFVVGMFMLVLGFRQHSRDA